MNVQAFFKNVRQETIYIELQNEGTSVYRPAPALQVGLHTYVVLFPQNYDPSNEEWRFSPGSVVACEWQKRDGKDVLVARSRADF